MNPAGDSPVTRVSEEEEAEGLDLGEHAMEAYPHFQTARN